MRKRSVALSIATTVLVSIFFVWAHAQDDVVTLEDSAFKDRQRPAAVFPHDEHNENAMIEECNVCHHVYEGGNKVADESSEGEECSGCHKVEGEAKSTPLMKAYHDMCKGCHLKRGDEGKKTGPVTCGECHPKKK